MFDAVNSASKDEIIKISIKELGVGEMTIEDENSMYEIHSK